MLSKLTYISLITTGVIALTEVLGIIIEFIFKSLEIYWVGFLGSLLIIVSDFLFIYALMVTVILVLIYLFASFFKK